MKTSELFIGSSVVFPTFRAERVYMRAFTPGQDLPDDLERWQPTVDAMLRGVPGRGSAFLMIDQAEVAERKTHRRPGLHVDGYWGAGASCHGEHVVTPAEPKDIPPNAPRWQPTPSHSTGSSLAREALIIATDVEGCQAFDGQWEGVAGDGGDCSGVDTRGLLSRRMLPSVAYVGETGSLLHASVPHASAVRRTVVRINLQGWVGS